MLLERLSQIIYRMCTFVRFIFFSDDLLLVRLANLVYTGKI